MRDRLMAIVAARSVPNSGRVTGATKRSAMRLLTRGVHVEWSVHALPNQPRPARRTAITPA